MQIVTYTNTRAPAGYQVLARIFVMHRKALEPLPVDIFAATADLARAKAQTFWDAEVERRRKAAIPRKGRPPPEHILDPFEIA